MLAWSRRRNSQFAFVFHDCNGDRLWLVAAEEFAIGISHRMCWFTLLSWSVSSYVGDAVSVSRNTNNVNVCAPDVSQKLMFVLRNVMFSFVTVQCVHGRPFFPHDCDH